MDEVCNLRLQALELKQELHKGKFEDHEVEIKVMGKSLGGIEKTLFQIKWLVIGALLYFTISEVGLFGVLEKVMGL